MHAARYRVRRWLGRLLAVQVFFCASRLLLFPVSQVAALSMCAVCCAAWGTGASDTWRVLLLLPIAVPGCPWRGGHRVEAWPSSVAINCKVPSPAGDVGHSGGTQAVLVCGQLTLLTRCACFYSDPEGSDTNSCERRPVHPSRLVLTPAFSLYFSRAVAILVFAVARTCNPCGNLCGSTFKVHFVAPTARVQLVRRLPSSFFACRLGRSCGTLPSTPHR